MDTHQSKVMRAPSLKRGKQDERAADRFKLEHVLGVTVTSNSALTCDPGTHLVAYPSGCTIVLFNTRTGKQHGHFVNACRKTITACSFSSDGRYLVTGECGHMPYVRIWDLQHEATTTTGSAAIQIAEFQGHQYGVNCVAFSPSNKYVVSVGSQHDMIVNVWDWKANVKVASNKVSTKVKAVAFAENGSYFVTVGNRHVKFWYLEYSRGSSRIKEAVPLVGRAAILGSQRGQHFVAVACGRGESADNTYAVTRSGLLCQLNNRRLLEKWLELRTTSANCMTVSETFIFVGCADGIVRCFDPVSLHFITTLPRTHHLGVDVSLGLSIAHMSSHPNNARYPDTVAVAYDNNYKLICVYNDHSVYIWDVRDIKRVGKSQSFLYHSACIWGIEMYPTRDQIAQYRSPAPELLPEGSFITCSSDDTIRIWNLTGDAIPPTHPIQRNIYSNELLKIIYVDPELNYIKDQDLTLTGDNKDSSYDGKNGVRSIRISPDGLHLASGDRAGNIRIYDMRTMRELLKIEAHDAEVLCLEYSQNSPEQTGYPRLLASASRDRLIHVFNVDDDYSILQSIDDHSSSITAVRFISSGRQLQMISCGADKSIIFRQLGGSAGETELTFQRGHNVACRTTLYDMEVEASGRHILTACQDRSVRVYSSRSGRHARSLRGSPSDDGSLIKITLDSGGRFMATSCTDKTLSVYCAWSGQLLGTMSGHSELATGLRFMTGGRRLVSASGDASVLVWKQAQKKVDAGLGDIDLDSEFGVSTPDIFDPNVNNTDVPDYRFSVGPLPLWAKKQITDDSSPPSSLTRNVDMPRGRWAQRVDSTGIAVKSIYDSDSIIQFPGLQDKRQDSDGSKESSMDSGNESRNHSDHRRENVSSSKQKLSENLRRLDGPSVGNKSGIVHHTDDSSLGSLLGSSAPGGDTGESAAEHDGDVEDCSDAEPPLVATKYYPNIAATDSPSEFTVNAMDVEELRKSQRKSKNRPDIISISTTSVSGSQESDFDDDDASTPSGDNGDKNLMSLFSASTESIDKIGQREKYIQSAFDSLSGVEQDSSQNKSSLSAQHYITRLNWSNIPARNVDVVKEVKQAKIENDSKRDELKRRIEETKRKLQSVGYKSNLKLSQSMLDLSPIPERDRRPTSKHKIPGENQTSSSSNESSSTSSTNNLPTFNISDYNIPANIKIPDSLKSLPFFNNVKNEHTSDGLDNSSITIDKFNKDMEHLVSETENFDNKFLTYDKRFKKTNDKSGCDDTHAVKKKPAVPVKPATLNRPKRLNLESDTYRTTDAKLGVLKLHKSLPVSPVSEEVVWADCVQKDIRTLDDRRDRQANDDPSFKRKSYSFFIDMKHDRSKISPNCADEGKLYDERLKRFVENQSDNPLDFISEPKKPSDNSDNESNFSSDSLEDYNEKTFAQNEPRRCFSNHEISACNFQRCDNTGSLSTSNRSSSVLLKKVTTECRIDNGYEASFPNEQYRNSFQMLRDFWSQAQKSDFNQFELSRSQELILNESVQRPQQFEQQPETDIYPEYERHSSASFYLSRKTVRNSNSQESILSDASDFSFYNENISNTNCNSLESVLSDESLETRSAPLEILFETHRRRKYSETETGDKLTRTMQPVTSPSEIAGTAGGCCQNDFQQKLSKFESNKFITRSKSFQEPKKKNIAYFFTGNFDCSENTIVEKQATFAPLKKYVQRSDALATTSSRAMFDGKVDAEKQKMDRSKMQEIPSLKYKNEEYRKKSCDLLRTNVVAKSKSCSFEVLLEKEAVSKQVVKRDYSNATVLKQTKKSTTCTKWSYDGRFGKTDKTKLGKSSNNNMVTRSLDRTNRSCVLENASKSNFGFESLMGNVVAHKPPKGVRRTVSAKVKRNAQLSESRLMERRCSDSVKACDDILNCNNFSRGFKTRLPISKTTNRDIGSFELSYRENSSKTGICENANVISERNFNVAEREFDRVFATTDKKYRNENDADKTERICSLRDEEFDEPSDLISTISNCKYLSNEDMNKFKDIGRKIEIINKLVEIEEQKICLGKVKRLSLNFEKLALQNANDFRSLKKTELEKYDMKRNLSLPNFLIENSTVNIVQENVNSGNKYSDTRICDNTPKIKSLLTVFDPEATKPVWPPATRCHRETNASQCKRIKYSNSEQKTKDVKQLPVKQKKLEEQIKCSINQKQNNKLTEPEKLEKTAIKVFEVKTEQNLKKVVPVEDELENSLRRACSLSDLANPAPVKTKHSPGKHANPPRTNQRYTKSANMTRSSSVDVLNASDSETEPGQQNGGAPRPALRNSLMRPTISSQNKVTVNKNTARRRTIQSSYSSVNLSTVGQEDSSSEELPSSGKSNGTPRPRTANGNGNEQSAPQPPQRRPKDASYKIKGSRSTSNLERFPMDVPVKDGTFDISTSQLSTQLCNQIAEQLMKTADNVVQLYKRLTLNDSASDDSSSQEKGTTAAEKSDMLKNLEGAIVETQRTLQMAIKQQQLNNDSALTVNHNQTVNQLKELVSLNSSEADESKIMLMMQQYSDILLKMMQEKMLSKN